MTSQPNTVRRWRLAWAWRSNGRIYKAVTIWTAADAATARRRLIEVMPNVISARVLEEVRP